MSQDGTADWIRAARDRHSIVDVLERLGVQSPAWWNGSSDFMISCPLPTHDDSTPSCVIHPATNRFYCFGCGARGDVLQLVQDVTGARTVRDAVEWLREVGDLRPIPCVTSHASRADRSSEHPRTSRERVLEINEAAWSELTAGPAAQVARGYLKRRGVDVTALEHRVGRPLAGYTPARRNGLTQSLRAFGFNDDELVDAGWTVSRDDDLVDRFHRRVVMPFMDDAERVLGVVGRDVSGSARAKYLNTARTPAFRKNELLYSPTRPVGAVQTVVVCEGPLDALAIESWAATHGKSRPLRAVAPSGTALTQAHAAAIADMHVRRVILFPDGDAAGQVAGTAWRSLLAAVGIEAELLQLPADQDPLSWLVSGHLLSIDHEALPDGLCASGPGTPIRLEV